MRNLARSTALLGAFLLFACDDDGATCPAGSGSATLTVTNHGLPAGAMGVLTVQGTSTFTVTGDTSAPLPEGPFAVTPNLVTVSDPRIRTVYEGVATSSTTCATR